MSGERHGWRRQRESPLVPAWEDRIFEAMFGGPLDDAAIAEIAQHDWRYEALRDEKRDEVILDLLRRLDVRSFSIAGQQTDRWETGWSRNLETYRKTGDLMALDPGYWRPASVLRIGGEFVRPVDPMFEVNWYKVFRGWFARKYLSQFDAIYEFGCGSGHNIAFLAQLFPDKKIYGYDWADSSVEIIRELRKRFPNVNGGKYDFFAPVYWKYPQNSAVLTVGALEQTGTRWRPFLDALREGKPAKCFHIEPIYEWYNPDSLVDHTAIKIHEARGFMRGFVKEIQPVRQHRTGFGSLLLEGYGQLAWKPE